MGKIKNYSFKTKNIACLFKFCKFFNILNNSHACHLHGNLQHFSPDAYCDENALLISLKIELILIGQTLGVYFRRWTSFRLLVKENIDMK